MGGLKEINEINGWDETMRGMKDMKKNRWVYEMNGCDKRMIQMNEMNEWD